MRTAEVATTAAEHPVRPFRIADAMVLMAALFIAMAWDRAALARSLLGVFSLPLFLLPLLRHAAHIVVLLVPFLVVGSLSLFALRLQPPRPRLRQLLQQPGTIACALASVASIAIGLTVLGSHFTSGRPLAASWVGAVDDLRPDRLTIVSSLIGMTVLMAWVVLRAKRQWRPESSWIDRLGRLVGMGWTLMTFGGVLQLVIELMHLAQFSG
jgi:hypothetical protein